MTRIEELRRAIAEANAAYWANGASKYTDEEFDAMVEELKKLTGETDRDFGTPEILSTGKIRHTSPMLSMQKVYDMAKVIAWARKYAKGGRILVMPKYDGIAMRKYADGTIATRGDGATGENATEVAAAFAANAPLGDGEAVVPISVFNAEMRKLGYKNPRNAVAGIVGSLDPEIRKRAAHIELVNYRHIVVEIAGLDTAIFTAAAEQVKSWARDYPMDGIVFRIADEELFASLGHTDHHWRGQIALKFANEATESIIESISWQENNGTITPVAEIAPVTLGGTEISRVTLHNFTRIREWDIRVGDRCKVERAGGVIPKITATWRGDAEAPATAIPDKCPTCGGPVAMNGARLYCAHCDK